MIPPFGPVDEIVSNDKPLYNSKSLKDHQIVPSAAKISGNSRSEFLQLLSSLILLYFLALPKKLFQPGKVPGKSDAVSNVTVSESLELGVVLYGLEVGYRGLCQVVVLLVL